MGAQRLGLQTTGQELGFYEVKSNLQMWVVFLVYKVFLKNLNQSISFKNQEFSHTNPDFWLLLKNSRTRTHYDHLHTWQLELVVCWGQLSLAHRNQL